MAEPEREWIRLREEFVQNLNGTSKEEILILTPLPALILFISVFIKCWVLIVIINSCMNSIEICKVFGIISFFIDFLTFVLPIVLQLTVFAEITISILAFTIILTLSIMILAVSSVNYKVLYWKIPNIRNGFLSYEIPAGRHVCITYFRTAIFLLTSISILAVDFHVFPRRFAKTENYGVSLMDLGVGLYIMANAIVTKGNLADKKFKENFYESLPLFCLGVIRCVVMQRIDYQKHTTEYGTHWNFFITLGLVKFIANSLLKVFNGYSFSCGVFILSLHQCILTSSLEQFVMSDLPRDNLITANREGIVSLPGYVSLYLIGVSTKNIIGNVDNEINHSVKTKLKSMILLMISFSVLFLTSKWLESSSKVSRRLANLPYVIWTSGVCYEYLIMGLMFELVSIIFLPINITSKSNVYNLLIPDLCKSINNNAFLFFLISNLSTGVINMYFDVLSFETSISMLVLLSYMFVNCIAVYILFLSNLKIKF